MGSIPWSGLRRRARGGWGGQARDPGNNGLGEGAAARGRGLALTARARGRRQVSGAAGMAEQWDLDEEGIRRLGALPLEQPGKARPGGPGRGSVGSEAEGRKLTWRHWGT